MVESDEPVEWDENFKTVNKRTSWTSWIETAITVQESDFSRTCSFHRMINKNEIFHFKQKGTHRWSKFLSKFKTIFWGFGPTCQEIFTGHVASTEWYTTMISFISSKKVHVNGQNFCQNSVIFEYLALLGPCFGLFFENQIFPGHANSGEWWTRMSYSILRIKING